MFLVDERTEEERKAEETELFTKYYTEWKGGGGRDSSYKTIPRFYYRVTLGWITSLMLAQKHIMFNLNMCCIIIVTITLLLASCGG